MDEEKNRTASLIAIVPREVHAQVKAMAALKGIGLQRYVAQAILTRLAEDQKYNS